MKASVVCCKHRCWAVLCGELVMSEYIEGVLRIVPCSGRGGIQFTRECSADDIIIHSSQ